MGKKGWFSAVKKALSPQPKEKKDQKLKSKKNDSAENDASEAFLSSEPVTAAVPPPPPPPPPPPTQLDEVTRQTEAVIENEQSNQSHSVAVDTPAVAGVATTMPRFVGKSEEEVAAIKIQTAFRGYLARRALRALRGLVRLKSLIEGQPAKRQSATTLKCMQTLARVQSQIRARRIRMSEENQALHRQLQLKNERDLEKLKMGEVWDDSTQSKERIEASLQSKQEAAMRRERALAYAFTHQQARKNSKTSNATFMDPNNPHWGWSWLERWMSARPWEAKTTSEKDFNDHGSVKSFRTLSIAGEINRINGLDMKPSTRPSRQSPSTPARASTMNPGAGKVEDDTKSMMSTQSDRFRRHSIAGSSVRDDESLASSPAVPSYMAPTRSASARTKSPSPLGVVEKNGTPDPKQQPLGGAGAKKRLSFPASPGGSRNRRHSVPARMERTDPTKDVPIQTEVLVTNGEAVG